MTPSLSDLRFELAQRQSRPAPVVQPKRASRTAAQRIVDLQKRVDGLKAKATRRTVKVPARKQAKRKVVTASRPASIDTEEAIDAEYRALVADFAASLQALAQRRTLARAKAMLEASSTR